jgi:hypothetical protein
MKATSSKRRYLDDVQSDELRINLPEPRIEVSRGFVIVESGNEEQLSEVLAVGFHGQLGR